MNFFFFSFHWQTVHRTMQCCETSKSTGDQDGSVWRCGDAQLVIVSSLKRWFNYSFLKLLDSIYSSFAFFLASPFSSAALPLAWPAASCALPAASPRSSAALPLTSPPVTLAVASLTLSLAATVRFVNPYASHNAPRDEFVTSLLTSNVNTVNEFVGHNTVHLLQTILGSFNGVLLQLDCGREGCSRRSRCEVGRACRSAGDICHAADGHLGEKRHFGWGFVLLRGVCCGL